MIRRLLATLGLAALSSGVWAGEALTGEVQKQPLNVSAIIISPRSRRTVQATLPARP